MSTAEQFAAWFKQRTGEAPLVDAQSEQESLSPSYPVVSDAGEMQYVHHEPTAAEQFGDWLDDALKGSRWR